MVEYVEAMLDHVGTMMVPLERCEPTSGHLKPILSLGGHIWEPFWGYGGMLGHVKPMVDYINAMLGHFKPMMASGNDDWPSGQEEY